MEFAANYIQITYTISGVLVFCVAFILSLKREIAVLKETVRIYKDSQDKINVLSDIKFASIDSKLDDIKRMLIERL